jgi:hypothetical protein
MSLTPLNTTISELTQGTHLHHPMPHHVTHMLTTMSLPTLDFFPLSHLVTHLALDPLQLLDTTMGQGEKVVG